MSSSLHNPCLLPPCSCHREDSKEASRKAQEVIGEGGPKEALWSQNVKVVHTGFQVVAARPKCDG